MEKLDETRAQAFVEDGYLWNSGTLIFRADAMLQELQRFYLEIASRICGRRCRLRKRTLAPTSSTMPRVLRQGSEDLNRLCGDGANPQGRGVDG